MSVEMLKPLFTEYVSVNRAAYSMQLQTPRVTFSNKVPSSFIKRFLNFVSTGDIKVEDVNGNSLNVKIY